MSYGSEPAYAYLPSRHASALLPATDCAAEANRNQVTSVLGTSAGCTLRLIADMHKLDAAYANAESLAWRDAGAVATTLCLTAEWMNLRSNVLGFAGTEYLSQIGFPAERFMAVGAVQISK